MKKLLLICGLNRSGTSTLTGALALCGVGIDYEQPGLEVGLRKEDPHRMDGGYESYEIPAILDFTRQVLQRHYASQNNPSPSDEIRLTVPEILTILSLTEAIPRFPFALKDPVFTFLFPAWRRVVVDHLEDISVFPLATMRHPSIQAEALLSRGFCTTARSALDRWLRYHSEIELLAVRERLHLVVYDGRRDSFLQQIESLTLHLDLPFDPTSIAPFFRPNRPKEAQDEWVRENHPLGGAILELYARLLRVSHLEGGPPE